MNPKNVVWITGASSGIGRALACEYAKQGSSLILSSRREGELEEVKQHCIQKSGLTNQDVLVLPLDITKHEELELKSLQARDAGVSQRSSCLETDMKTYRTLFEVDVFGQIALTKVVLPIMVDQGSGHIAVTASVAGKIGVPYRTGYCAVKHAMMGFFDSLRSEVAHQNIQVSTITPGYIRTDVARNALTGQGLVAGKTDEEIESGMDVDDCAKVVVKGLNKGKKEIAVGKGIEMHALWIKRFFPSLMAKILEKEYGKRTLNK